MNTTPEIRERLSNIIKSADMPADIPVVINPSYMITHLTKAASPTESDVLYGHNILDGDLSSIVISGTKDKEERLGEGSGRIITAAKYEFHVFTTLNDFPLEPKGVLSERLVKFYEDILDNCSTIAPYSPIIDKHLALVYGQLKPEASRGMDVRLFAILTNMHAHHRGADISVGVSVKSALSKKGLASLSSRRGGVPTVEEALSEGPKMYRAFHDKIRKYSNVLPKILGTLGIPDYVAGKTPVTKLLIVKNTEAQIGKSQYERRS